MGIAMGTINLVPLHVALAKVCPTVCGVSVPNQNDRSTWVIQHDGTPTDAQLAALSMAITDFDIRFLTNPPADTARVSALKSDAARADLLTRLQTATPAEIDSWLSTNVKDFASATTVLSSIIKALAITS